MNIYMVFFFSALAKEVSYNYKKMRSCRLNKQSLDKHSHDKSCFFRLFYCSKCYFRPAVIAMAMKQCTLT